MTNTMIIYALIILSVLFLLSFFFFYLKIKKLTDYRTLNLGRLWISQVISLLFFTNLLLIIAVVYQLEIHKSVFSYIGIVFLFLEMLVVSLASILIGFFFPLAIIVLIIKMWRRESKSFANFLLPILLLLFWTVDLLYIYVGKLPEPWVGLQIISYIYPLLAIYLAWQFCVFFISSWIYGRKMRRVESNTFVVLGSGLINGQQVGVLLGNRIRAAVNAARVNDKAIIIFSGGQGSDEKISEAEAMQKYAVEELNFPIKRTLIEPQSRSTYENLIFSSEVIDKNRLDKDFIFFTSDYHVFRTALFAKSLNLHANGGIGGKTAMYYRVSAFIREFIAVLNMQRKKHVLWIVGIGAAIILLATIAELLYYFNT